MLNPEIYWMSYLTLVRAWWEFLEMDCPVKEWDQLLEEYGENEAAAKFRLDTQLIRFRDYCKEYGVSPIDLGWLQEYLPDVATCESYMSACQCHLEKLPVAISPKDSSF